MSEGIQQSKEAAIAAVSLSLKLIKLSKDGMDFSDIAALMADAELVDMLKIAADGASKIPAEMKDVSMAEGFEIASAVVPLLISGLK